MSAGFSFHAISSRPKPSRESRIRSAVRCANVRAKGGGTSAGREYVMREETEVVRPTKEDRKAALEFFESVLAVMNNRRIDEITVGDIRDSLGIVGEKGDAQSPTVNRHLAVVDLQTVEVGRTGGKSRGICCDQVERAVRRLQPARPNVYRGQWS